MRHTFVVSHGIRVGIQQSKIEAGAVLLSINYPSGERFGCATIPASTAALIAQAFEMEAAAAELLTPCAGLCDGVDGCKAVGLEAERVSDAARQIEAAMVSPYGDTSGVPKVVALPVVDLPQVDAPRKLFSDAEINAIYKRTTGKDAPGMGRALPVGGAETVGA